MLNIISRSIMLDMATRDVEGSVITYLSELDLDPERLHENLARIDHATENNKECNVCMEEKEDIRRLGCNHMFCIDCITRWARTSNACPMCRSPIARQGQHADAIHEMFDSLRSIIYAVMWHDIRGSIENILREDGHGEGTGGAGGEEEEGDVEIEITFDDEEEEEEEED